MQRAAASSPLASTPSQTPDHHSAKRQKLHNGVATPTSTGTPTPLAAADDFTPKLPWNAAGETQWVVNIPPPTSNATASSSSDDEDSLWSKLHPTGRQTYGSFKRRKSILTKNNPSDDLSSLSSGDEADIHPLRPMARLKDREKEEAAQGRRLDRIDLSRMQGVSGSAAMTGAGMRRGMEGREKAKHHNKGRDGGRGNGSHNGPGGVQNVKKRKTM